MNEEKFKDKISESDRKTLNDAIKVTQTWLDANEHAEKDELENKQKEVESQCGPIIARAYQASGPSAEGAENGGSAFGGADGGDLGASGARSGASRVDEVD
jgi:heat shock 70kDa protein 1/2/6/8